MRQRPALAVRHDGAVRAVIRLQGKAEDAGWDLVPAQKGVQVMPAGPELFEGPLPSGFLRGQGFGPAQPVFERLRADAPAPAELPGRQLPAPDRLHHRLRACSEDPGGLFDGHGEHGPAGLRWRGRILGVHGILRRIPQGVLRPCYAVPASLSPARD